MQFIYLPEDALSLIGTSVYNIPLRVFRLICDLHKIQHSIYSTQAILHPLYMRLSWSFMVLWSR